MHSDDEQNRMARRRFLRTTAALGLAAGWRGLAPAYARPASVDQRGQATPLRVTEAGVDLVIARTPIEIGGRAGSAITLNGTVPGPLLRFREGEMAVLRVTNRLDEPTSIHWHGVLVPQDMDGVPGVSFPGIRPGETFTYRYRPRQNGTYWYHSHSGLQEQAGHYAPIIIDPAAADPVVYDREHVIMLSDWTFANPDRVVAKLKKQSGYFNFQQRTVADFFRDAAANGWRATAADRAMWGKMRMDPTDIADVTGYAYTYLVNGLAPEDNWTALFRPGERVRLRFIDAGAATLFNVRIPGLALTVVQADGQNVQPVTVDEFQIGPGETYDVIVEPRDDRAYTIFAESMDRSGYARGTLAPRAGMSAPIPALRKRPLRTMVDMGMDMGEMGDMDMPGMEKGGAKGAMPGMETGRAQGAMHGMEAGGGQGAMPGMEMGGAKGAMPGMEMGQDATPGGAHAGMAMPGMAQAAVARHGPDTHGPGNTSVAWVQRNRLAEPGAGLDDAGHRVLVYADLRSLEPNADPRPPGREIELHLTGNMENFMWGFDGKKFSEAKTPIQLAYGERVRITLVNDTMMEHPMHLHGMFKEIDNGAGAHKPRKHTVTVKPAERLSFELTVDEPGNWVFHCHLLLHMDMGMLRVFNVPLPPKGVQS